MPDIILIRVGMLSYLSANYKIIEKTTPVRIQSVRVLSFQEFDPVSFYCVAEMLRNAAES